MVGSAILRNLQSKGFNNFVFSPYPEYDLTQQETVKKIFSDNKPEYVFLAAAKVGGILANNSYRAQFIYENLQIQNNIIHQSYIAGVKKLIFLGSSCIYPANSPQPIKEESLLTSPLEYTNEPYAVAKIAGIKMCESYNIQYGTNFISVMPTNLYGKNDNFDLEKSHVLPAILRKMHLAKLLMNNNFGEIRRDFEKNPVGTLSQKSSDKDIETILFKYGITKENISLWSTGNPRREFLHADDLAEAIVYIYQSLNFSDLINNNKTEIRNTHINIGSGEDQTVKELAVLIKKTVNYKGEILWDTSKPDGTPQKLLDVSKLRSYGWKQATKLEDGIRKVYENYIRTQLGNYHGSFSSDCPHRERLGYTGDGQLLVERAQFLGFVALAV